MLPSVDERHELNPLSTRVYLLRNKSSTAPLVAIIMLAVMLTAGVVALIHSIPDSIQTIYAYSKQELLIAPRTDLSVPPDVIEQIRKGSPVPIERIVPCRDAPTYVKSIVGKWPFFVIGLGPSDLEYFLARQSAKSIAGRRPAPGAPEAIVSEPVARNLGLRLGSILLTPDDRERFSLQEVRVVGVAQSANWFMLTSIDYLKANQFPPIESVLMFAPDLEKQAVLDTWALRSIKDKRVDPFAYRLIGEMSDDMFHILYQVLNIVIFAVAGVLTFVILLLMNIYQSQRNTEFGLLQAIGFSRSRILKRVVGESAAVIVCGWGSGVAGAHLLLRLVKAVLMEPHAFVLNAADLSAFGYTVLMPVAVFIAAIWLVLLRFRSFDPVGILDRRAV